MRTFGLLQRTYTAIQLEKVQAFLGLEADVVLQGIYLSPSFISSSMYLT